MLERLQLRLFRTRTYTSRRFPPHPQHRQQRQMERSQVRQRITFPKRHYQKRGLTEPLFFAYTLSQSHHILAEFTKPIAHPLSAPVLGVESGHFDLRKGGDNMGLSFPHIRKDEMHGPYRSSIPLQGPESLQGDRMMQHPEHSSELTTWFKAIRSFSG